MSLLEVHPKSQCIANACNGIVLALADSHAPSWQRQEDNPGFDGLFGKALTWRYIGIFAPVSPGTEEL